MDIIPIFLPVCHETDQTEIKKANDIPVELDEYEIRNVKFYSIDAISDYWDNDKDTGLSTIFSCGTTFICSLSPKEVDKKIISLRHGDR